MMKKRALSIVMALALCLGFLPAPAWAEEVEPAATVLTVQDNQSINLQKEDGQPRYVIYSNGYPMENKTFTSLVLTGSAQGVDITISPTLPENTSVTLRNLQITTTNYKCLLDVFGNREIVIEGDVSFSAAASPIGINEDSTVSMTGPGNLTVKHNKGKAVIENKGSLAIDIKGDVRMEAPEGVLFDNNSGANPISISAKNITLSDSTDNTSFDGMTLTLSRTSSINGQSPVALVRVSPEEVTYYTDIQAAFAAAPGGSTIELLADVTLPEGTSLTVDADKMLTLNCGDFTLSGSWGFVIQVSGTLNFIGGTLKNTGRDSVVLVDGGTFTMSDGTLEAGVPTQPLWTPWATITFPPPSPSAAGASERGAGA